MKQRNKIMLQDYKSIETKKIKNQTYLSDLADRNLRECRTIWWTERGSGSSHGRSL